MMTAPIIADGDRNILDSVLLSERAVERWQAAAAVLVATRRLDPATVANEDAEVLPGGDLRLFCADTAGAVLLEITIPAHEWAWSERRLQ